MSKLLKIIFSFLFLLILIILAVKYYRQGVKKTITVSTANVVVEKNIAYGNKPKQKLDLCKPKNINSKLPAVILLHGGKGDKSDFSLSCQELANRGVVAISVNYREEPSPSFKLSLEDTMSAVDWLKNQNEVDEYKIAAMGGSYGGLLASLLGTMESANKVSCVVNNFGPTDLTSKDIESSPIYREAVDKYFGGVTLEENKELYEQYSPIHNISTDDAFSWLLTRSLNDELIPRSQMTSFESKLKLFGLKVNFIEYRGKGKGHANNLPLTEQKNLFYQRIDFIENCLKEKII